MDTQYEKLKKIIKQMFQMDQADLDFGIYRIMNQKRDEIEHFLDKELLPQVKEEFAKYKSSDVEDKQKELAILEKTVKESGLNPDDAPKVKELRGQLAEFGDEESLINEVFSHLATFFRRYYDDGDFLSLRRYKKDTYAIPYEGEEVKLHWANADQYYIKSTEYLKVYVFKIDNDKRVHFKLVDATEEKDNIKQEQGKERKFKLYEEEPIKVEGNGLYIQFTYLPDKAMQVELNRRTVEYINSIYKDLTVKGFQDILLPKPTPKNPKRTLLEKHLNDYTARFNFDFFIHKDLGGFLRRELDFYIKNEVLFIDDLDEEDEKKVMQSIRKFKVLKHIAQKIITFLAQLEEFQKKMWLKKKFVVDCGYCVTLDRVSEGLYEEIVKNDAQREEWVRLFAINEIEGDLMKPAYSEPLTRKFLEANPYLALDTKFFNEEFKEKLLASFDNVDEECDGVIINSENFQALNLMHGKYHEQMQCVYIDPPYNTDASAIIYKNNYKDSSWLSLMENRLTLSSMLLKENGIICVAIDDEEISGVRNLLSTIYQKQVGIVAIRSNPAGRKTKGRFAPAHEYALFFGKSEDAVPYPLTKSEKSLLRYPKRDEKGRFAWANFIRSGNNDRREDRPKLYYPIVIDKDNNISIPKMEWSNAKNEYVLLETPHAKEQLIFPVQERGEKNIEKNWQRGHARVQNELEEYRVRRDSDGTINIDFKTRMDEGSLPITWWDDKKYASANYGAAELKELFGRKEFDFSKAKQLVSDCIKASGIKVEKTAVMDFFGGSGTTAHAVISLNREDGGRRKFILVEMGQYFDTILKPRIQKVVYSKDWKDGKPTSREGISHMFKYMKLESYDDTLDNLIIKLDERQQKALDISKSAKEDYVLGYMLDIETRESDSLLNIDRFEDPFNYTLKIRDDNELKTTKIDLIETFNFLIGLYVEQTDVLRGFKVIRGKLRTGEKTLVIWRNTKEKSNEELDKFFTKQGYNTQDFEFDKIFVNGDNNLENLKVDEDRWKVSLIEEEFKKQMFGVTDI